MERQYCVSSRSVALAMNLDKPEVQFNIEKYNFLITANYEMRELRRYLAILGVSFTGMVLAAPLYSLLVGTASISVAAATGKIRINWN